MDGLFNDTTYNSTIKISIGQNSLPPPPIKRGRNNVRKDWKLEIIEGYISSLFLKKSLIVLWLLLCLSRISVGYLQLKAIFDYITLLWVIKDKR